MDGPYGEKFKSFLHTYTSICTDLRQLRHKIEFLTYIDVFQHLLRCIVYKRLELGITDGNSVWKVLTSQWENKLYTPPKKTASPRFVFKNSSNNAMMIMIIKAWSYCKKKWNLFSRSAPRVPQQIEAKREEPSADEMICEEKLKIIEIPSSGWFGLLIASKFSEVRHRWIWREDFELKAPHQRMVKHNKWTTMEFWLLLSQGGRFWR